MSEDEVTAEPQEASQMDQAVDEAIEVAGQQQEQETEQRAETQVPLSALQKERKKRQELELELKWERQRMQQAQEQTQTSDEDLQYESATKADLLKTQEEIVRAVEERTWIKNNPEKYEKVNELLPQFLKQRPNLAYAINSASNRYEEAYVLMDALTPKEQRQLEKPVQKKAAPGSPGTVPKSTALSHAVDVMSMSDSDFNKWRQSQRKRR